MFSEIVLAAWSAAGLTWWTLALWLTTEKQERNEPVDSSPRRSLSIFKPLPPLGDKGLGALATSLESFVAQLDPESELLLGMHEADRSVTASFVDLLHKKYPQVRLKIIFRDQPDDVANPKIAWQKILAPHAEGELWLWSDADIIATPDFLASARSEFAQGDSTMVTFPYVIRNIPTPPALLEALFVNTEFYPGVLLLRKSGPVDFGLGAAMLFARNDFLRCIDWGELGACLADDFYLGQKLKPVRIGSACLVTLAGSTTWKEALTHDLRWTKTIRWNRPGGSFARILVMPMLGWIGYVAWHPGQWSAWIGLAGMVQADVIFAVLLCQSVGCKMGLRNMLRLEVWSFWRIVLWLLAWLPLPVHWSGKKWVKPIEPNGVKGSNGSKCTSSI